jgi:predicted component of type VI protein secretion system
MLIMLMLVRHVTTVKKVITVDNVYVYQTSLDLQADKSTVVVKGPFFPQVWTQGIESVKQMCDARTNLLKPRTLIFKGESYASNLKNIIKNESNLWKQR